MKKYLWLFLLVININVYSQEELFTLFESLYEIPKVDFEFSSENQEPLLQSLSLLEHLLSENPENEYLPLLKEFKEDLYSQKVNAICFPNENINAFTAAFFNPKPDEWDNPTIYISSTLINKSKTRGISFIMRSIAEYLFWKENQSYDSEITRLLGFTYADKIQVGLIDNFNKTIGFPASDYEKYLVSTYFNDNETLNSQMYFNRCIDPSIVQDFEILTSQDKSLDIEENTYKKVISRIENYVFNETDLIQSDNAPYNLNNYLRFVIMYSHSYYLTYYAESISNSSLDLSEKEKFRKDLENITAQLKDLCISEVNNFQDLRGSFGERIYWYY